MHLLVEQILITSKKKLKKQNKHHHQHASELQDIYQISMRPESSYSLLL